MTRKSEKASRKLHERSAKALTSWDGPPFDRGVAVPTEIWRSQCLAVPTQIWRSQLGSVQCPLKSGARGWGPAVPTEIWSSWLRAEWRTRIKEEEEEEEAMRGMQSDKI